MTKQQKYEELLKRCRALVEGESDPLATMANVIAEVHLTMGFLWTGVYRVVDDQLVLGPFQGPVACTRIRKGRGVCGACWDRAESILVPDVDAFPGHIRCSSAARSEIVIPIFTAGSVSAVFDIDSAFPGSSDSASSDSLADVPSPVFSPQSGLTPEDLAGLEPIIALLNR